MEFDIVVGDLIQARKQSSETSIAVLEFNVEEILEGGYDGSPLGPLYSSEGWSFELCRKADPGLPTTLSDLAVWLSTDPIIPTRVVGPINGMWQTQEGKRIDHTDVLHWEPWSDDYLPAPEINLNDNEVEEDAEPEEEPDPLEED